VIVLSRHTSQLDITVAKRLDTKVPHLHNDDVPVIKQIHELINKYQQQKNNINKQYSKWHPKTLVSVSLPSPPLPSPSLPSPTPEGWTASVWCKIGSVEMKLIFKLISLSYIIPRLFGHIFAIDPYSLSGYKNGLQPFVAQWLQSQPKRVENIWDIVWFWTSHVNYSYNDSIPPLPPTNVVCIGVMLNTGTLKHCLKGRGDNLWYFR